MTAQPRSLAETSITLNEFARYLNRNVLTVRKWFIDSPDAIKIPRGGQRAQILIPISVALAKCREMHIPEVLVQTIESDHKLRAERAVQPVPVAVPNPPAPPVKRIKEKKTIKPKKRVKAARAGGRR